MICLSRERGLVLRLSATVLMCSVVVLALAGCGGDGGGDDAGPGGQVLQETATTTETTTDDASGAGSSAAPGTLTAELDGKTFALEVNLCRIEEDEFAFGAADPESGANASGGAVRTRNAGWAGAISVRDREVPNDGFAPVYTAPVPTDGSGLEIGGRTLTFSGEFSKATPETPLGEGVGRGRIAVACS